MLHAVCDAHAREAAFCAGRGVESLTLLCLFVFGPCYAGMEQAVSASCRFAMRMLSMQHALQGEALRVLTFFVCVFGWMGVCLDLVMPAWNRP